jgi:hypothetical protein
MAGLEDALLHLELESAHPTFVVDYFRNHGNLRVPVSL